MHFSDLLFRLVEKKRLVRDALPAMSVPVPLDDGERPPPAQVDLGVGAPPSGAQFNRKMFGLNFGLKNSLRFHFESVTCPGLI